MKKLLLAVFTLLLLNVQTQAQALPNSGFENWNSSSYNDPNGWDNGNSNSFNRMGATPVTRVTGQSGYGLRIETIAINGDTSDSYISNTNQDPLEGQGGVPYSQQPTALTGYYRYNLPGNDSAGILVIFKKNSAIISMNFFMIKGTGSQNNWTAFSFPLTVPVAPDSLIMAAVSSNLISGMGIENGSFLELDGLGFTGASQAIPDGNFENWTTHTIETPAGWNEFGDSVFKTTDNYSGTYAAKIKTVVSPDLQVFPSGITTGQIGQNGFTGGLPYIQMSDTLKGYYKYIATGDTAGGFISLSQNGSQVGGMGFSLEPASGYTYFEVPFIAFQTPDTMQLTFVSSSFNNPVAGSTLYLDGLTLTSILTAMNESSSYTGKLLTYPNPASDVLNLEFSHRATSALIRIYDISGRMVKESVRIIAGTSQLNVADLTKGIYTVELRCGDESFKSRFVKE